MAKTKYEYTYTIKDIDGKKVNYKCNRYKKLMASSQSKAKMILNCWYPHCIIIDLHTKTGKFFDTSNGQMGRAIFL